MWAPLHTLLKKGTLPRRLRQPKPHVKKTRCGAGASAFEWQQEIGLNQARRTGEVADMDALLAFAVAETQAAAALGDGSSQAAQPDMLMAQVDLTHCFCALCCTRKSGMP